MREEPQDESSDPPLAAVLIAFSANTATADNRSLSEAAEFVKQSLGELAVARVDSEVASANASDMSVQDWILTTDVPTFPEPSPDAMASGFLPAATKVRAQNTQKGYWQFYGMEDGTPVSGYIADADFKAARPVNFAPTQQNLIDKAISIRENLANNKYLQVKSFSVTVAIMPSLQIDFTFPSD